MASEANTLEVPGAFGVREIRISSPRRVLWPDREITKLDLANYLVAVGSAFVAANGDRPISLQRHSSDIDEEMFYSKNPPKGTPAFVRAVPVVYPSGRSHPQLVLDEPAAAVWAVQMNTVVFHPWASRAGNPGYPDELRIDLDPQPGTNFDDAIPVATALRDVLAEAGLEAFVKTSGNRGLQVFVSIAPTREFLDVRHAVIAAAREFERRMPTKPERLRTCGDPWASLGERPGDISILETWWKRDVANGLPELPFPPDFPKMPGEPPRVQPSRARAGAVD